MNILQLRRMSVNSLTLDYSLWVKVGQTFLNLFTGSNRVIVCSESSNVQSDVYFFVQDSTLLFQWSVPFCSSTHLLRPLLLNLGLLELTSWQQYVLLHCHKISVHLNSSLKRPGSFLSRWLCFPQYVREKKFARASSMKLSTQSFDRNLCHFGLISGPVQCSSSFSARTRYSEFVSISNSSNLLTSQNLVKKL